MKFCFVQKGAMTYFGVASIAGYLKKSGHEFSVVIDSLEKQSIEAIKSLRPDVIGISVSTPEHGWLIDICRRIKSALPDIPIIVGGVHAIMYPEILIETEADFLCNGEGESVIEKMLGVLQEDNDLGRVTDIPGIVYRKGMARSGTLVRNRVPELLADIEWEEDSGIYYDRYPILAKDDMKQFMSQRGCPYDCNFCYNHLLRERTKGHGRYFRRKKPELFVKEMQMVIDRYGATSVSILDDLFTFDKTWLMEFAALYRDKIGIPYICQIRADHADEEIVSLLADSGCFTACVGLETGNEELRYRVLNKRVSNQKMFLVGDLLRKYHINLKTGNMFGIPGETEEMAFETIGLNLKIGTRFLGATMLLPFPGTKVEKIALEKGWLDRPLDFRNLPPSFYSESVFKAPQIQVLTNIMSIAQLCIFFPRLFPLLRRIVHFHCRPLFKFLHFSTLIVRFVRERNLGLFYGTAFLWRFRKSI
ncbi:MAG TPA: radical SAM protein [Thermodesulfovibrionales bacterium]|nr:radical SAM protein [Thermodesulfovibrionales bacterium]